MILKEIGLWVSMMIAFSGLAAADTVTLKNGDQLRGEVISEEEEVLVFKAEMLSQPLEIPRDSITAVIPEIAPKLETAPAIPTNEAPHDGKVTLPENWDARMGLGFTDRKSETSEHREISAEGKLAWKGKRQEAQWKGFYEYHNQDDKKSADRYGASQRIKHRGDQGFYVQARTKAEVDHVTKKRATLSQTAGFGFSPIEEDTVTLNVTPGVKAEHITEAESEAQNGTSYKAHVQQDLKWQVNDGLSIGQELSYSIDPRHTENWDLDFNAFVETKVSEDVNLRLNYRRDFLNQSEGAPDKEVAEVGALLVWDF